MLVITVDLLPGGYESHRRTMGTMRIANVSDLADASDYAVDVREGGNPLTGSPARRARCWVTGHDRRQAVRALLAKAAEAAGKAEFDELRKRSARSCPRNSAFPP
ncbi:hypothetical protein [Bradyrhizobium sp. USDA 10063]